MIFNSDRKMGVVFVAIFILASSFFTVEAKVNTLDTKITMSVTDSPIDRIFKVIEQQSNVKFSYDNREMSKVERFSLTLKKVSLQSTLNIIEKKAKVRFNVKGNYIAVALANPTTAATSLITPTVLEEQKESIDKLQPVNSDGYITGVIVEKGNNDFVIGASVLVKGLSTMGTITAVDGTFSIKAKKGDLLLISSIGFARQEVRITGNSLKISLAQTSLNLGEVVVQGHKNTASTNASLTERKAALVSQDAISQESMEKSAAISTTQALEKVTGVTVANGKDISIRGVGDRNVVGQINGARIANANADNNSVAVDIIPAGLLENITVYKSITPDKPADATAGIIELRTKSFPNSRLLTFSAQAGTNTTVGFGGEINSFINSDIGTFGEKLKNKQLSNDFLELANQYQPVTTLSRPGSMSNTIKSFLMGANSTPDKIAEAYRIDGLEKSIDPVLTTAYKGVSPNSSYSLSYGDKFKLGDHQELGFVVGVNYNYRTSAVRDGKLNNYSIYDGMGLRYPYFIPSNTTADHIVLNQKLTQREESGNENLNYGGLIGLGWRFAPGNEISANYLTNLGTDIEANNLYGRFTSAGATRPVMNQVNVLKQEETKLDNYQIRGTHKLLPKMDLSPKIDWLGSYSLGAQITPDYRFSSVVVDSSYYDFVKNAPIKSVDASNTSNYFWQFLTGSKPSAAVGATQYDPNSRAYRTLNEENINAQFNLTVPFEINHHKQEVKVGYFYMQKDRDYTETILNLPSSISLFNAGGDLNRMVATDNVGIMNGIKPNSEGQGFSPGFIYDVAKSANNYSGSTKVNAAYLALDLSITAKFKLNGGVRFEKTDIHALLDVIGISSLSSDVNYGNTINTPLIYPTSFNPNINYNTGFKPYYSVNGVYSPSSKTNLRASFNTTLARPELRELMPITQYDPFQFAVVTGNPKLKNQFTQSSEVRWEFFPSTGEVLAATVYGKIIYDQLSQAFSADTLGTKTTGYTFNNVKYFNDTEKGYVLGTEFEIRKSLDFIIAPLGNMFVGMNLMLAYSRIKKNPERLLASRTIDNYASAYAPLVGQAPYSISTYLDYSNKKSGTSITVNFNMVGERLTQIVMTGEPDIYTMPTPTLDMVISQRFLKKWTFKGYMKNILDPYYRQAYTTQGSNGSYFGNNYYRREYKRGSEVMLGFTYDLF
jgi:hypothetical protein